MCLCMYVHTEALNSNYAWGGGGCGSMHTGGVEVAMIDDNKDRQNGTRCSLCKHQDQTE